MRAIIFMLIAWALFIMAVDFSEAHDAPSGWSYDVSCCNTTDCRPVEVHSTGIKVVEVIEGWKVTRPSGKEELVLRADTRIKESKDEHYHVCTSAGHEEGFLICIYVPFRGI